jgi:hypothetical protein
MPERRDRHDSLQRSNAAGALRSPDFLNTISKRFGMNDTA